MLVVTVADAIVDQVLKVRRAGIYVVRDIRGNINGPLSRDVYFFRPSKYFTIIQRIQPLLAGTVISNGVASQSCDDAENGTG